MKYVFLEGGGVCMVERKVGEETWISKKYVDLELIIIDNN